MSRILDFARVSVWVILVSMLIHASAAQTAERVMIQYQGWELIGDLLIPAGAGPVGSVLLLNKAAGDREVYRELAAHLENRGMASLRLDLPGHGESTNLGPFVPGERQRDPMIWDAEKAVSAARHFLSLDARLDPTRTAVVGASYSGEEMAEAGRIDGYASAYVALSPGSFDEESIEGIDSSERPWLFVTSRDERYLQEIRAEVRSRSSTAELITLTGDRHGTDLLDEHPGLAERISVWLSHKLR